MYNRFPKPETESCNSTLRATPHDSASRIMRCSPKTKKYPNRSWGTGPTCAVGDPIITCTTRQVGRCPDVSLLPTSNTGHSPRREACNPQREVGVPYKKCGFNGSLKSVPRTQQENFFRKKYMPNGNLLFLFVVRILVGKKFFHEVVVNFV